MQKRRVIAGVMGSCACAAALLLFASCDKDGERVPKKPPLRYPDVPPERGGLYLSIKPDDRPKGKVEWLDEAAWTAARPGSDAAPGFKLLYFRTPREFGCGLLERFSFGNSDVAAYIKERAAARFTDPERDEALARRYGIAETPALVVLDRDGGYAGAINGHRPPARLIEELKKLAAEGETQAKRAGELADKVKQAQGAARVEALDAAAELAMKRKAFAEAERLLGELAVIPEAAQTRALAELHGRRAQALAELGRTDEAAVAFEKAIAADTLKMYAEKYAFQRGQMLLEAKRNDAALAAWDAFLKDYPKSPRAEAAAYNRIFALLRLDRKSEAAHEIEMMLQGAKTDEAKDALRLLLYSSLGEGAALSALKVNEAERQSITDALLDGRELVKKFSCNDCHLLIEPQVKSLQQTCVECHLVVRKLETEPDKHDDILKTHPNFFRNCTRIRHLLRAPNLFGLGARVRGSWVKKFLENPYDVRPHLEESMVPLNLDANEIEALVRYFQAIAKTVGQAPPSKEEIAAEAAAPKQDPRHLERGRELFAKGHCYQCHQFGNVKFAEDQGSWGWMEGRAEAPNLRYARERLVRRTAFDWIRDPAKMSPGTRMPQFNLSDEDVIALVDYIFEADPGKPPADLNVPEPARKAAKPPTWDEINAAVFQETCIHCHQADNLGGPGNTGAYGYRARRLDLSSYAGIRRGSLQPDGTRLDILKPREGGLAPLILERVGRRVEENKRDKIEPFRDPISNLAQKRESRVKPGMPFGHPALTQEQIALLQAWLDAGAPGPKPKPLGETDEKKKAQME